MWIQGRSCRAIALSFRTVTSHALDHKKFFTMSDELRRIDPGLLELGLALHRCREWAFHVDIAAEEKICSCQNDEDRQEDEGRSEDHPVFLPVVLQIHEE